DQTFSTLSQRFEPGYVEGHDAGGVSITTITPVLGGKLLFGSVIGERQAQLGLAPSVTGGITPTQAKGDQLPSRGYLALTTPSSVVIGGAPSANFTSQSQFTTTLSSEQLSAYGLSLLSIKANDLVLSAGSTLKLADGGSLSVTAGGAIDIAGNVSAAGGSIKLVTDRFGFRNDPLFKAPTTQSGAADIFVEGTLDVSGRWVNDTGRFGTDVFGPGFINGGSISITTTKSSGATGSASNSIDSTGSILLAAGSVLDVSSGGYISSQGTPKKVSPGVVGRRGRASSLGLGQ